jgi:hypothetical protein
MKTRIKSFASIVGQCSFNVGVAALLLMAGTAKVARADMITYANIGTPNPVTYAFTATTSGDITAYFAGATAGFDNEMGMMVNGVSTGVIGLDNHTSTVGQSLDLGYAAAGATIVFELINNSIGEVAYSDPSLNVAYDAAGENQGHNHVYAAAYTATTDINDPKPGSQPILLSDNIPAGTYISFEDLPFTGGVGAEPAVVQAWEDATYGVSPTNSDFDYNDESFIVTDVATATGPASVSATTFNESTATGAVPDSASTLILMSIGFAGIGWLRRTRQV